MRPVGSGSRPRGWRLAVVEDHRLQRLRTEELLSAEPSFTVVRSSESLPEFIAWLRRQSVDNYPDLLILDLVVDRGPNVDPAEVAALVRTGIRVLVLSAMASTPLVREVLKAGVSGVVGKRDPESDILGAVWTVLGRGQWMTPELASVIAGDERRPRLSDQEERALVLYASGLTLAAVAAALGVKKDTAKTYLERVKRKYHDTGRPVRSKVELSKVAYQDGYVDLNPDDPA